MPYLHEASHTYIFVALIEQFGVFETALILTAITYLIGFPLYLAFKGVLPSKSKLFLLMYCFISSAIGSSPFWAGQEHGVPRDFALIIPLLLLPFGVYFLFVLFDKVGFIKFERHSPSLIQVFLFLILLFILPVAAVIDWTLFEGQHVLIKVGEYSVLLTLFGLSAMGAFTFLLLLMPIVGIVSTLSAVIRRLSKDKESNSESFSNEKPETSRYNMKLQDCGCGGSPHVTVHMEDKNLFHVSCPVCGSSTHGYDTLRNAQLIWNTWCCKQGYRIAEDATA